MSVLVLTNSESLTNALESKSWKIKDEWLQCIKNKLATIHSKVTILWIPSHCDITGNERADKLANDGREKDQSKVPVTHAIIKAKIKARPWQPTHAGAKEMYDGRLKPKFEVEANWTRRVRSLFARLRSNHAKELAYYQHKIGNIASPNCKECEVPETIKHLLCECPSLEEARARNWPGKVNITMMISHPDVCRQILEKRFQGLKMSKSVGLQQPDAEHV